MEKIIVEVKSSFKISTKTIEHTLQDLFGDVNITVKEIPQPTKEHGDGTHQGTGIPIGS